MGESNFTPNYQFEQPHEDDFYDVGVSNRNMAKIDNVLKLKTEIIITETNIPIESRKSDSFYLIVTDSAPTPSSQNITVSPTMGLKKVEE